MGEVALEEDRQKNKKSYKLKHKAGDESLEP